jgi:hypothetical protein
MMMVVAIMSQKTNVFVRNWMKSVGKTHACPCPDPLNKKFFFIIFKYLVCISQKTLCVFYIKIYHLILYKEIIAAY